MKILIFTEGTALMHKTALGVDREERVRQSSSDEPSVNDFKNYIPNGNVVEKLDKWSKQGAEIYYLTSRRTAEEIKDIQNVLTKYKFPDSKNLLFRTEIQDYKDVAEELIPDILIEDDCESIGGEVEMTFPHMKKNLKNKIKSIVIKEFAGIDHLSDNIENL